MTLPLRHRLGASLRTRSTLLFRVRDAEDAASWEEFHRLYRQLVYGRARRAGLPHEDAEDVTQDVFKRVAETIKDFEHDPDKGSFRGWLMRLTHWRIADQFERRKKAPSLPTARGNDARETTGAIEQIPAAVDDNSEWDREWQQQVLAAAVERVSRQVKPRHFQVFELYIQQDWPALRVARALGINPASIYLIAHRLTKLLKLEAAKLQKQLA